ncbi:hypothetical protein GWI33_021686, partial [Rhynchophorus ferrugineus]
KFNNSNSKHALLFHVPNNTHKLKRKNAIATGLYRFLRPDNVQSANGSSYQGMGRAKLSILTMHEPHAYHDTAETQPRSVSGFLSDGFFNSRFFKSTLICRCRCSTIVTSSIPTDDYFGSTVDGHQ